MLPEATPARAIASFEAFEVDPEAFSHREHVHLAWAYLDRYPVEEALPRFARGLEAFAVHHGASTKYHATITWAFVLLIHQRRESLGPHTWPEFEAASADLLRYRPSVLERYYRSETLASPLARRIFVMPDRISAST